ncbi:MAG: SixA phosphatase family protein [Pyrinomonadaceae bacterium]
MRARQTAELVIAAAEVAANVHYDQRIYEASPGQLLEVVSEVEDDVKSVLLVGHNPAMEELLSALTGQEEQMGTGTLAKIGIETNEWSGVLAEAGSLDWIVSASPR